MKLLNNSAKFLTVSLTFGFFVVFAATLSDIRSNSADFMNTSSDIKIAKRLDDSLNREIASAVKTPRVLALDANEENIKRINGIWNIYNIVDDEEKININASFELIGKGIVRINGDENLKYYVSYLTSYNTIALFKQQNDGSFEIIEARKLNPKKEMTRKEIVRTQETENNSARFESVSEFNLDRNNVSLPENLKGAKSVSGNLQVRDGDIAELSMVIEGNQVFTITEETEIGDGGAFVALSRTEDGIEEKISGVILSSGKGVYTVRIATGKYAGTVLNFGSDSEDQQVEEQELAVEEAPVVEQDPVQVQVQEQAEQDQERVAQMREQMMQEAASVQKMETEEVVVPQEQQEQEIQAKGFDFSNQDNA